MQIADVENLNLNEIKPEGICNHLEHKYFPSIRQLVQSIDKYIEYNIYNLINIKDNLQLFCLQFQRLKDEIELLIKNDTVDIFPLIRNDKGLKPCPARKLPVALIAVTHQKIIQFLKQVQQQGDECLNELSTSNNTFRIFCDELYSLGQQLQQMIDIKENILLPKVEKLFNQKCSGACKLKPDGTKSQLVSSSASTY